MTQKRKLPRLVRVAGSAALLVLVLYFVEISLSMNRHGGAWDVARGKHENAPGLVLLSKRQQGWRDQEFLFLDTDPPRVVRLRVVKTWFPFKTDNTQGWYGMPPPNGGKVYLPRAHAVPQ